MNLILTITFFSKQNNGKDHEMLMLVTGNILNGTWNVKKKKKKPNSHESQREKKNLDDAITKNKGI